MRRAPLTARLAWLGILSALVDLGSAYVKFPLGPRGVTAGDWIQLLGAFPLLALYAWVALDLLTRFLPPGNRIAWTLFLAAVAYALGFGVHVAANSIHDMLDHTGLGDPWGLAYFWDERLGHYFVDAGRVAFAVALTAWEAGGPALRRGGPASAERGAAGGGAPEPGAATTARLPIFAGALAYGFIYFATGVEGQTVPLALPFSAGYAAWSLARRRDMGTIRTFYTAAAIVTVVLFAIWGIWHRGFPEFSRTGLL